MSDAPPLAAVKQPLRILYMGWRSHAHVFAYVIPREHEFPLDGAGFSSCRTLRGQWIPWANNGNFLTEYGTYFRVVVREACCRVVLWRRVRGMAMEDESDLSSGRRSDEDAENDGNWSPDEWADLSPEE